VLFAYHHIALWRKQFRLGDLFLQVDSRRSAKRTTARMRYIGVALQRGAFLQRHRQHLIYLVQSETADYVLILLLLTPKGVNSMDLDPPCTSIESKIPLEGGAGPSPVTDVNLSARFFFFR